MSRWPLDLPARKPAATICVAIALAALAAMSTARLRPDASLQSLFSPADPAARALSRVLDDFPGAEKLLVLVGSDPQADPRPDALLAFADRFSRRIREDSDAASLVAAVTYRADAQTRDFVAKVIVPNGLFYLDDASFAAARQRLTRSEMAEQFRQNESMLAVPGPAAGALAKALLQDPLRLHEFLMGQLASAQPAKTYGGSDAFLSSDGRSLLIEVAGTRPPGDLPFCHKITQAVTRVARSANSDALSLKFSGAYPIAAQSESSIRHDSIASVIGSIASLGLLFALTFRRPLSLFTVTFAPVALGVLYGLGVYAILIHHFSPLTGVIGSMLAGIGIDYSIFYLVHYLEQRSNGVAPVDAAHNTIGTIGGALVAAWVTSVVGFAAVGVSSVRLLRDFSLAGSLSLVATLLCSVFVLPALLVLRDRRGRREPLRNARWSFDPLVGWVDCWSGQCLLASLLVVCVAVTVLGIRGPRLELENDPSVMHPRPNPPLDAQADIARRMGAGNDSLIVHLQAASPDELLRLAHRVRGRLNSQAARDAGVISTFGLSTFLPDPQTVPGRLAIVGPKYADQVTADFDAAVADSQFAPAAYAPYRAFLHTLLAPASAPGVDELAHYPQLAQTFLPRSASQGVPAHEAITLVFIKPGANPLATSRATVLSLRALLNDLPGATLTGMAVLSLDTQATIQRDLPRLILAAVAVIAFYLLFHFRSIGDSLLAVLPTCCSMLCLLTIARICQTRMNLANIVSIPLLIGIDVDYGIFLVSVARKSATRPELRQRMNASAQAVSLCAAATLLGFGSLAFTSVPAIRSLGWAVVVGVVSCALASLFLLLPLLLRLKQRSERRDAKRPSSSSVVTVLGALALACFAGGCSAPSGRLFFPSTPLCRRDNIDWYDVRHNGRPQFGVAFDASGNIDRLLYDDTGRGHIDREYRLSDYANGSVPHVILLLDSIPYQTMDDRYKAGDFRWFGPPQKMIAPFPSFTEVCYSDVLHAPPLPGVIDQYFDPRDQQRKNILWRRACGYQQPWERRLHYTASTVQQGLSFLKPEPWYAAELELARQAIDASPDRVTIVYIASAASMVCKFGEPGAQRVLDGAKQFCLQLLYERRGAIKITMMADHGHNYTPSKNVSIDDILTHAGFHPADRIRSDNDCVVEINALVTCAGVHTVRPAAVAAALCARPEIELAIYTEGPRVIVRGPTGSAAIECDRGLLRYVPIDADVLGYAPVLAELQSSHQASKDGYADDDLWFHLTLNHPWPNAPRRIWDALHGKVINPPTVLFSMKDGFYAGDPAFEKYIQMASTHGGLNQINSATFVMSMTGRLSGPTRHEKVIQTVEPGFEPRVLR